MDGILKVLLGSGRSARLIVAGVLMLLVWLYRRYGTHFVKVPDKFLPLLVAGLALVAELGMTLGSPSFGGWGQWAMNGFLTGAAAVAMWSTVGKFLLPTEPKSPPVENQ